MTSTISNLRSTALAALLSLPVAAAPVFAQDADSEEMQTEEMQPADETGETSSASGDTSASESGEAGDDAEADALVATVDGVEIRGSDVMTVIGALPPQMQSQPAEMLVPMAMEQLILRELILEQARAQNLAEDPDVMALVEGSAQAAEEDAMVQIWLDRELADVVSDEAVQQVYEQAQAEGAQELPPLEEARPQIEQLLLQEAMQDIQTQLRADADVVFYDAMGQPVEEPQGVMQSGAAEGAEGGSTANGSDGSPEDTAGDTSGDMEAQGEGQSSGETSGSADGETETD